MNILGALDRPKERAACEFVVGLVLPQNPAVWGK